jgi:flavin-dependent dehydrogenase
VRISHYDPVQVVGAGPAGLAAAITLAREGRRVVVHEAQRVVGHRFQGDFQGVENWSTERDALTELRELGIGTNFFALPCDRGTAFDAWDQPYPMRSTAPLFYMVERGPGEGSLDMALLSQALSLGVEVRFGSRVERLEGEGILALGPKAADAIAVGYHFDADMQDAFWVVLDEDVAPGGYAYLLVTGGRGTVKTCMFRGFKEERLYVERTVERFRRLTGLRMRNERFHGGVGNFRVPATAVSGGHPVSGEQAGFQDALAGFGMRYAIESGVLAARSFAGGPPYEAAWRKRLKPTVESSLINRAIYGALGNRGYRWLLRSQAWSGDTRRFLRWLYRPGRLRRALLPWAERRYQSARRDRSCDHVDCACVWCRCGAGM